MSDSQDDLTSSLDLILGLKKTDQYHPMDAYRDFRKVFLGTDEGKRVLREILSWGRVFRSPTFGNPIDPYAMAVTFGERNMALKLLATINHEPRPQATTATRKKE